MILVDMNQITIGNIMAESKGNPIVNEDLIRHMVVNSLRTIRTKNQEKYGELIVCYDYPGSWRKRAFSFYKENRKKQRKKSDVDWSALFDLLNRIRVEITENLPYKVMIADNCEADDIIAVLAKNFHSKENVLIVSSDGDFQQLQKYPNIDQYSPIMKKLIRCEDPYEYLFEHVIRGDSSDGVPNILSPNDVFLQEGTRQSSISSKKYAAWLETWKNSGTTNRDIYSITNDAIIVDNINRNRTLIDFDCIPEAIQQSILDKYQSIKPASRDKIMTYFASKGMRNLIQHISEF